MKQPKIVFAGHVVIDHNRIERTVYESWGSPAMFMTRYFQAKFGLEPTIIASYGPDFLQYASGVKLLPGKPNLEQSTVYENIVLNGRRTQYCHGAGAALPDITPDIKAELAGADIVFLAPLTPAYSPKYVSEIMSNVRADALKVLLPQGYLRRIAENDLVWPREFKEAPKIVPLFDLVVLSNEDHLHADARAHDWKRLHPATEIIVTRNAEGADIISEQSVEHVPTTPILSKDARNPVGLGDVFSAAAAYELRQTHDLPAAVRAGHAAAREHLLTAPTN